MKEKKQISFRPSFGTLYAGVEAVFLSRTECVFNITVCRKKQTQLEIETQAQHLGAEAAKKILKKVACFYLAITGKPVIYKKLSRFYENPAELLSVILPDARQGEFVAQCSEASGTFYGAVLRRDVLHEVLNVFTANKLFPHTLVLGPAVLGLLPSLTKNMPGVSTSAYTVIPGEQSVHFDNQVHQGEQEVVLGHDQVNTRNLTGLCLCLQAQTSYPVFTAIDDTEAKKVTAEAIQKKKFKTLLPAVIVLLLVITSGNFFINKTYAGKHAELEEQLALNRQMLDEIEKLERDIDEKRLLLGKRPGTNGPVISLIGDRLAASVPIRIRLQNLEIFPVQGKISKEKPVGFSFNKVVIEGISSESDVLDSWIGQCKKFDWVKDVLIVKYTFDKEKRKGVFKLELLLR